MAYNQKYPGHILFSHAFNKDENGEWAPFEDIENRANKPKPRSYWRPDGGAKAVAGGHVLELYLDYVCPFSKKQFMGLVEYVSKYGVPDEVTILFRHQVQPWHPSSTLVHEAALQSASRGSETSQFFWLYSHILFENQDDFFDVNVVNETRNQTYERLIKLYAGIFERENQDSKTPDDPVKRMREALMVSDKPGKDGALNVGNKVTDDLKWCVKLGRQNGIHVSPTVLWDGVVENSVSSSFGEKEWIEFFEKNI